MKKNLLLGVALAAFTMAGLNGAKAEDTIAVIVKATTSEYWQWVFKGAEDAGKQLGVKVDKLGTPKDDAAGQIAVLESAAGSKPAAIVISPTIYEALGDPTSAVTDAGVPVIMIDSGAKTDKYAAFLTTNNEAGGKAAADAMAQCIKERTGKVAGKVGYLTAMAGHESLDSRDKGFVEGLKAYPDLKLTGHLDSIQLGTGSRFTAFPPENATGNYVKIVQRVPVKIVFDSLPDVYLGPGMSVMPTVKVR